MYAIDYEDFGTPAPVNGEAADAAPVTLEIDGRAVTVPDGTSVMRAAALAGVRVPKLCATDTLKAFGSCRLCLVEIEGRKGYPASCTTTVAAGMKIRTQSDKLMQLRRSVMELYLSDYPIERQPTAAEARTELCSMAETLGVRSSPYANGRRHVGQAKDESNPYFTFDPNLCIVCSRCVRACDETQGTFALTVQGRGMDSKIAASQDDSFLQSECVSCGACVEACPTGALIEKPLISIGAPDRSESTTCAYCGVGCTLNAELKDETVIRMVPNRNGRANQGHACVKGRFAYGYATHADRILKPMIREKITDPWHEVSWDEAINYAAERFKAIQAKH